MLEYLGHTIDRISITHLNVLLLLGLALFGGTIGGRIFQKLYIPQVVGYIMIGLLIGQGGLSIIDNAIIETLKPFNYFALGLIGFMVGGELKKEVFAKYGRHFLYILLCEGITPALLVTLCIGAIGSLLFGATPFVWALALLLGAIASATDPATTSSVLKEYKTKGPLTTTILGIVALDDGLALILFSIASSIAGVLIGYGGNSMISTIIHPFYEIGGAIVIGILSGFILCKILNRYAEKERILAFSIGTVLFVTGLSLAANVSMLLAVMTLGIFVTNFAPRKSKEAFSLVEGFTPPIYILFFVLVGAQLKFSHITLKVLLLILGYLVFGMSGKMLGAHIGARLSQAHQVIKRYLPLSLFSQAGVAIGLSILAAQHFPGEVGSTIIIIITATTFVTQIIGPPFTKLAVSKAGEVGLNITEEDLIAKTLAKDIMDKNPPLIYKNMHLTKILEIFSESTNLCYPVVDNDKKLLGIISVDNIRNIFIETGLDDLLLAVDVMEPSLASAKPQSPVSSIKELLGRYNLECLPVVTEEDKIAGFIERRMLDRLISTKIMELQKQSEAI